MTRDIEQTAKFRRDYKRESRSDPKVKELLVLVLDLLVNDEKLPERLRDHALTGEWRGFRDCHLKPDLVLIYAKVGNTDLKLVRLGSHSELFS